MIKVKAKRRQLWSVLSLPDILGPVGLRINNLWFYFRSQARIKSYLLNFDMLVQESRILFIRILYKQESSNVTSCLQGRIENQESRILGTAYWESKWLVFSRLAKKWSPWVEMYGKQTAISTNILFHLETLSVLLHSTFV